jgi:phosphoribosylaminoimidazole-succinocarboxamide synthase
MNILDNEGPNFASLPTFFEGNSRILKQSSANDLLLEKLKPTIFSHVANGPILLPGIDIPRRMLSTFFCSLLEAKGLKTATICSKHDLSLIRKEKVAPIEVVVKSAFVGSPKHLYLGLDTKVGRDGTQLHVGARHAPYVRFDWRNPLPTPDCCMPEAFADRFIDTKRAKETALSAFHALKMALVVHDFDLLDICFFMNEAGDTLCGEISTDNSQIVYTGCDPALVALFANREKENMLLKAQTLVQILIG